MKKFSVLVVFLAMSCSEGSSVYHAIPESCSHAKEVYSRYFEPSGIEVEILSLELSRTLEVNQPQSVLRLSSNQMTIEELGRQGIPQFDGCALSARVSSELNGNNRVSELVKIARQLAVNDRIYGKVEGDDIELYFNPKPR